jgi:two-component system chemotaxis sensor kinase CheA
MDPVRYRALFVEEASEHLGELGRAFLTLEKDPTSAEALEVCFRMAHSVKGMAAAMHFVPISELAHALEDRFEAARRAGRVPATEDLPRWFAELDVLERMVNAVRDTGQCPEIPVTPAAPRTDDAPAGPKKKARSPARKP